MSTFLDYAPHLGVAALVFNSAVAIFYFLWSRRQGKELHSLRSKNDALAVDNVGLRAQNARLVQRLARLLTGVGSVTKAIQKFDPTKEGK